MPYVDILMTLMAFLVLCAAWTKFAALDAHAPTTSNTGDGESCKTAPLVVEVTPTEYRLSDLVFAHAAKGELTKALQSQSQSAPQPDCAPRVIAHDGTRTEHIVGAVDALAGAGLGAPTIDPA